MGGFKIYLKILSKFLANSSKIAGLMNPAPEKEVRVLRRIKLVVAVTAMIVAMLAASAGPAMADIFNGNNCDRNGNCNFNGNNCDFNGNCGFGFNGCGTIIAGICMPFDFGFDNTGFSGIGQTVG
jgi:hypothetical protein